MIVMADTTDTTEHWVAIAEADGWEGIDPDRLTNSAVEALAWALLDQTSDIADRAPSQEAFEDACQTAIRMLQLPLSHSEPDTSSNA